MPVHLYGLSAEMDKFIHLCKDEELLLIEDAAQGVGVKYKNQHVGTLGDAEFCPFMETRLLRQLKGVPYLQTTKQWQKNVIN